MKFSGRKHTDETKRKISMSKIGVKRAPFTKEHKDKIGDANRGKKHSAETRAKMCIAQRKRIDIKPRVWSAEARAAVAESNRRRALIKRGMSDE